MIVLKIFLFIFFWLLYYLIKGLILKIKGVRIGFAITTFVLFALLTILSFSFSWYITLIIDLYLVLSIIQYLLLLINKKTPIIPIDSFIYVKAEEVTVKYTVFKPLILLITDIYFLFKRLPLLGFKDDFEIMVNTKKDVQVLIKI